MFEKTITSDLFLSPFIKNILKICGFAMFMLADPLSGFTQKFTISGYVKDQDTGETLIGANVYNKRDFNGTTSNNYGFYSLTIPKDSITLVFSYVGYESKEIQLYLDKNIELNVSLGSSTVLDEVVVTAEEEIQQTTQMSRISIPIKQIKSLPAFLGEVDVMKVLQLLPGVQSGNEGSSGLYVRGGGPDQNLILLDGVPVYNASHLFGFFSVFNADAINNVELIKGGFPARYGGRLSSVIDINMKEGNNQKFQGEGSVGLVATKLTLEGPIKNENTTFIVSGRRTYIDFLARPIIKASSEGDEVAGYYFYDVNAKVNHKFSNKDRIYLSGYFGNDKAFSRLKDSYNSGDGQVNSEDKFGLNWGNITTAFRWNHVINPKLFGNLTLTYSRYKFNVSEEYFTETNVGGQKQIEEEKIKYFSGIRDFAGKLDFDFTPSPNHFIRFGANAINHTFNPGIFAFKSNVESDTTLGSQRTKANEFAVYIEDDFKINTNLKVNAGLHVSGFSVNKEFYYSIQPRIATRYLLKNGVALKASYAQMTQYIHLLTNSGIGLPTDLWVPATDKVRPQESYQVAFGLAKTVNEKFEVSLEGYYKEMKNLIEYKEGANFLNTENDWQTKVETGDGESYGAELLIQKNHGKLTGWLGYTLSWTNRQFDNLNFGKKFPYRYDRRHDIGIAAVYKLSEHIELSGAWVYGTGNAISLPIASYRSNNQGDFSFFDGSIKYYESRNSFRMKSYHRLDASISFHKKKRWGERWWVIGLYNAYNRKNPFFIDIGRNDNGDKKFIQYSLFPVIPSVSYKFKF
ncbi:TonB-dependent receptor [Fulvivirgaceae bacterium BMA10]|uniref:TonB-dependent receptor n=1 Tax=Splendidivirga corallicola TaxID=3051826 RepID=A0ABT8KP92_9BACT|nr:TonB-dependent receptor [Fulvivirgaceae bacterium BMA10]